MKFAAQNLIGSHTASDNKCAHGFFNLLRCPPRAVDQRFKGHTLETGGYILGPVCCLALNRPPNSSFQPGKGKIRPWPSLEGYRQGNRPLVASAWCSFRRLSSDGARTIR